ncbi:MAG: antitoxin MazE-like protein [Alphaproteobacteria bacterium]|nr:antitoxin MazE-like protein [Alphaproteobacteria bacterium]
MTSAAQIWVPDTRLPAVVADCRRQTRVEADRADAELDSVLDAALLDRNDEAAAPAAMTQQWRSSQSRWLKVLASRQRPRGTQIKTAHLSACGRSPPTP